VAVTKISRWWKCRGMARDKRRGEIPEAFRKRLSRRLTLRPDMSLPHSFLVYDYLAFHRATPNYARNTSRPVLYVLLGRDGFVDNENFMRSKDAVGLFDEHGAELLRKLWKVNASAAAAAAAGSEQAAAAAGSERAAAAAAAATAGSVPAAAMAAATLTITEHEVATTVTGRGAASAATTGQEAAMATAAKSHAAAEEDDVEL